MLKKTEINTASVRVKNAADANKPAKKEISRGIKKKSFWTIIFTPFRAILKTFKRIWARLCAINVVGLLNLTLLTSIIVLFSILIIDICGCKTGKTNTHIVKSDNVFITEKNAIISPNITDEKITSKNVIIAEKQKIRIALTLPLKKELVETLKSDTIKMPAQKVYGDVIIDGMFPDTKLYCGAQIYGNVYLQNMRTYTLPCDIKITGNLFLRNVGMLKFCGSFTIVGNIYVSPNSSFGSIPRNARLGGQVIL